MYDFFLDFLGEKVAYHSVSLGFYMDQLVRRVDPQHRSLSQFFKEEIAEPLGQFVKTSPIAFFVTFVFK